jgi:amino acid transporter
MTGFLHRFYDNITRKKTYDTESLHTSQLKRCLTVFDLTILGIGSTLGTGTYIITGQVAHETAGPSVILSFLIAAIASVLAGKYLFFPIIYKLYSLFSQVFAMLNLVHGHHVQAVLIPTLTLVLEKLWHLL